MRWLIIALLVSLVALLVAAAGMVRHIWRRSRDTAAQRPSANPVGSEADLEP
jgi:hypothetical protein